MILRCLPQEVLASDISEFEASGAAATEIGLPMNMILSQLPSGKVEMTLQELVPHFPPGYLQPTESIVSYLPNLINLPLMDVVMRIPPDLLALRPDQKDVDAAVINMADPFTEEILREQAESARKAQASTNTQTNIIDESQVPVTEEFVPRDQASATRGFIPPPRTPIEAMPTPRLPAAVTVSMPPPPRPAVEAPAMPKVAVPPSMPPMPPVAKVPMPAAPSRTGMMPPPPPNVIRANSPIPPAVPNSTSRTISPSGRLPAPTRPTTPIPIPARPQAAVTSPVSLVGRDAPPASAPTPPPEPEVPMPRPPSSRVPQVPQPLLRPSINPATPSVPVLPQSASDTPEPPARVEEAPATLLPASDEPVEVKVGEPDAAADELQRLAALAMKQLSETEAAAPATPISEPVPAPSPSSIAMAPTQTLPPTTSQAIPQPPPPAPVESASALQPVTQQTRLFGSKTITAPMPAVTESAPPAAAPAPEPPAAAAAETPAHEASASMALNLNSCTIDELLQIPGCTNLLAESIVRYRNKIGSFRKIEDLLEVPGMNSAAYSNLTGEAPPQSGVAQSLADLLGFPPEQKVTLRDVTDRISCWPDVTGCVLSQKSGLSLVGSVPKAFDRDAIVAFAPRMFEAINRSFGEIAGKETDELIIPTTGTSFHIFRSHDLYLIILARLPQMPDRHIKIARLVLAGLSQRPG